jgi:hypothetical protein
MSVTQSPSRTSSSRKRRSPARTRSANGGVTCASSKRRKRQRPSCGARCRLAVTRAGSSVAVGAAGATRTSSKLEFDCSRPSSSDREVVHHETGHRTTSGVEDDHVEANDVHPRAEDRRRGGDALAARAGGGFQRENAGRHGRQHVREQGPVLPHGCFPGSTWWKPV